MSMERLLVVGPETEELVEATTLDTSWETSNFTEPPCMICGLILSVRPTSLRSMVWNGVAVATAAGLCIGTGNERHVLADHDLGFFVVQRHQVGRGQDIGIGVALQRVRQHAEVKHRAEAGQRGRSVHDADVQALSDRCRGWLKHR